MPFARINLFHTDSMKEPVVNFEFKSLRNSAATFFSAFPFSLGHLRGACFIVLVLLNH